MTEHKHLSRVGSYCYTWINRLTRQLPKTPLADNLSITICILYISYISIQSPHDETRKIHLKIHPQLNHAPVPLLMKWIRVDQETKYRIFVDGALNIDYHHHHATFYLQCLTWKFAFTYESVLNCNKKYDILDNICDLVMLEFVYRIILKAAEDDVSLYHVLVCVWMSIVYYRANKFVVFHTL